MAAKKQQPSDQTGPSGRLPADLTFEKALAELEEITDKLEDGKESLEDSMKLFERGQALVMHCGALLEAAQLKVQKLVGDTITSFEEESE